MLFETSTGKTTSTNARPVQQTRPIQQTRPVQQTRTVQQTRPVQQIRQPARNIRYNPNISQPQTARVIGFPTRQQQSSAKSRVLYQQGVRKPYVSTTAGYTRPFRGYRGAVVRPGQKPIRGWNYYGQGVRRPFVSTTAGPVQRPGQRPLRGWTYYRQGQRPRPSYYTGQAPPPVYTSSVVQPQGQRIAGGWNYYPYCPPSQTISQRPQQQVCHACGLKARGCITLSGFAFNSSQLNAQHRNQIRALADRILQQNINAVIATGHTDSSGTENYNEALGARRASAVVRELRKQLSMLRPNAHKNLFWRIDSKGEIQPVSQTNPAANRRVAICVRRAKF